MPEFADLQHVEESLELAMELLDAGAEAHAKGIRWPRKKWLAWGQQLAGHVASARSEVAGLVLLADTGDSQ